MTMLKYGMDGFSALTLWEGDQLYRPTQFTLRKSHEPKQPLRLFEVCGEDCDGLIHSFHTDNRDQADDIAGIFREDLANVEVHDHS